MSFLDEYLKTSLSALEQALNDSHLKAAVEKAVDSIYQALNSQLPLLVCGNGGSAADAQHIAGEMVGRFKKERKALPVISLAADVATLTALGNDYGYEEVFARQVEAYAQPGGVLLGLSTSGNSLNVIKAFQKARQSQMLTIAFTGKSGGLLRDEADILIAVPSQDTPIIQQLHLCLYHYLCYAVEKLISEISIDAIEKVA